MTQFRFSQKCGFRWIESDGYLTNGLLLFKKELLPQKWLRFLLDEKDVQQRENGYITKIIERNIFDSETTTQKPINYEKTQWEFWFFKKLGIYPIFEPTKKIAILKNKSHEFCGIWSY